MFAHFLVKEKHLTTGKYLGPSSIEVSYLMKFYTFFLLLVLQLLIEPTKGLEKTTIG
jgi:hypothetical protein